MQDLFSKKLNEMLVETFYMIQKAEETALKNTGQADLSMSEFHVIECIGKGEEFGRTVGDIAQSLGVTLPTVTVAVNKLEKKGYACKAKSAEDGRVVYISLTPLGKKMDTAHRYFHERMVRSISKEFKPEETEILFRCIENVNDFFKKNGYFTK